MFLITLYVFICQVKEDRPILVDDNDKPEAICGSTIKGSSHNKSGSGSRLSNLRKHLKTKHKKIFDFFYFPLILSYLESIVKG